MQKACVWMYQKGKQIQPLKSTQIYQNEQTQIDARGRFYSQNKQTLIRSKKSIKPWRSPRNKFLLTKGCIWVSEHNKKKNIARNNCARPGSDTEANVQTSKHAKVRNWTPKTGKQCTKVLQKIRWEGNCTYNKKKQANKHRNQQQNAHSTRDTTPQNAVIYTSAKSAPIITQFFVQKRMKNHRTKSKLEK